MKNKISKRFLVKLACALCIVIPGVDYAKANNQFSQIVFFGDSLSDNGNLYSAVLGFIPKSPPYYEGRFSNGQVWSDYTAKYYHDKSGIESSNYAIGGQTAIFHNPTNGYLPYTLTLSRDSYLIRSVFTDRSKTLFVIWIGANDYLKGVGDVNQLTTDVVESIKYTVENLIYHGGLNFLIVNLPAIDKTPFGINSTYQEDLKAATILHNLKLDAAIEQVQEGYKNVNIHLYNANRVLNDFMENVELGNQKYHTHINNVTQACWQKGLPLQNHKLTEQLITNRIEEHLHTNQKSLAFTHKFNTEDLAHYIATTPDLAETYNVGESAVAGVEPCINPDDYLFWDRVHPSAVVHEVIARNMIEFVDENY